MEGSAGVGGNQKTKKMKKVSGGVSICSSEDDGGTFL
jgi:hypothetical protein